jgi:hypothetical protein
VEQRGHRDHPNGELSAAAIESIIAWLDAGQPDPDLAADRVRHVIAGVITAAAARGGFDSLPNTT